MTTYAIYKTDTGQCTGFIDCPESALAFNTPKGCAAFVHQGEMCDGYVSKGGFFPIGRAPSENHIFNYTTKQWEDFRSLVDFKTQQWDLIKQARANAEYAGFTWDGSTFDSDATSQSRITGAVTSAQLSTAFSIDWILANNLVRTLNQTEMLQVGAALGNHVAEQFSKGVSYRTAIDVATTAKEIQAVVWE